MSFCKSILKHLKIDKQKQNSSFMITFYLFLFVAKLNIYLQFLVHEHFLVDSFILCIPRRIHNLNQIS